MTQLYVDNYRGFVEQIIPIRKVNFMVGENSSGKSSILDILDVLGNRSFWMMEPNFEGSDARRKNFKDLVSIASKNKTNFTIAVCEVDDDLLSSNGLAVTYKSFDGSPKPTRITYFRGQIVATLDFYGGFREVDRGIKFKSRVILRKSSSKEEYLNDLMAYHKSNSGFYSRAIPEDYVTAPSNLLISLLLRENKLDDSIASLPISTFKIRVPQPFSDEFVNLAPIRAIPQRMYDGTNNYFNKDGGHAPYLIKKLFSDSGNLKFKDYIQDFGKKSGLFEALEVKSYGKSEYAPFEVRINLGAKGLDLKNVGLGVSQALPIIVEIFARADRTIFAIQQPEVHLHPKAQAKFGSLIYTIAENENKSFFVETHSDFTIDRFRIEIRENKSNIDSQVLFFTKRIGFNKIHALKINKSGDLPENQPEEYRDFFINESLDLLG